MKISKFKVLLSVLLIADSASACMSVYSRIDKKIEVVEDYIQCDPKNYNDSALDRASNSNDQEEIQEILIGRELCVFKNINGNNQWVYKKPPSDKQLKLTSYPVSLGNGCSGPSRNSRNIYNTRFGRVYSQELGVKNQEN